MSQNPYQATTYQGQYPIAEMAGTSERAAFIQKTYLHLLGAVLAFVFLETAIITLFDEQLGPIVRGVTGFNWLIVLGAFMGVSYIADRWAHSNTSRGMQYLGLSVYVVAEAIIFIPLIYMASHYGGEHTIASAGIVSAVVFGGLTITVLVTKADFSFLRYGLVVGGFVALALIVAAICFGFPLGVWFSVAMVLLASGIILFNTSNILHQYNTNQHVAASLALFASVALLFWYVLQIFMSFDE
jgi:FtsH-binding integral membrane protein